jgi:ABC-type dipeptide/oligopeptide/nickel transport system permease subunit
LPFNLKNQLLIIKTFVMKKIMNRLFLQIAVTVVLSSISLLALGQEKKSVDVDIDVNKGEDWYMQPWVWVVGGAVFILLLVALLKSGGEKKSA